MNDEGNGSKDAGHPRDNDRPDAGAPEGAAAVPPHQAHAEQEPRRDGPDNHTRKVDGQGLGPQHIDSGLAPAAHEFEALVEGKEGDGADRLSPQLDDEQPPRLDFIVVGIGASAGGLEAYSEFLRAVPPDSGMAYVLIQHLSPKHESILAEILAKQTSVRVRQVEHGMAVEPNNVYVIRPGYTLTINKGLLLLGESAAERTHRRPVDDFFRSLAEEQRERAICILLSGTGSNGTAGAEQVKAVGGVCIAQDPESAKFPSMPRSLIDSGLADYILKPEEMPAILARYAGHSYARGSESPGDLAQHERQALGEILSILRTRTRIDFSGYKKPTLVRRIQRRMGLLEIAKMADYARTIRQSPGEATALSDDLMIHVTGFFRDPEVWDALNEHVIMPLVNGRADGSAIRAWVTACSSGEEAYTLGMLLLEAAESVGKHFEIKIFATDTAERSLSQARQGVYPGGIESEIVPSRLDRFFEKTDAFYHVRKELRELVVFAPQNVLQDPPFGRLDICTCRNLMIYLEANVQIRLLSMLHFGLLEGGTLLLGNSESVGELDNLFVPIHKKHRIYRRVGTAKPSALHFPLPVRLQPGGDDADAANPNDARLGPVGSGGIRPGATIQQLMTKALLARYTPAAVVIDRQGQIVYFHGNTERYIDQPRGDPTRNLLELANDTVRGTLHAAMNKAVGADQPVVLRDGTIGEGPDRRRIEIAIGPLDVRPPYEHFIVAFTERSDPVPLGNVEGSVAGEQLSFDLARARDELQSTIEELQTANEEMKASHEEVTSINEELQSANEELETSKEELQSLNEELTTVNAQLQAKIDELERTTNDLTSLLSSTDIAVVFLDATHRIRRFTPAVRGLFDLIPADIGRPLSDLARKFQDPELSGDVQNVLERLTPLARSISSESGRHYLRRVLPYRTSDNRIDGVVVTFVDITERIRAEQSAMVQGSHLQLLSDVAALLLSADDLTEAIDAVFQRLAVIVDVDGYFHYRTVGRGSSLKLAASRGIDAAVLGDSTDLAPDQAVCGRVAEQQRPMVVEAVQATRGPRTELIRKLGITAYACFPLVTPDGLYGTLSFTRRTTDRFPPQEVALLQTVCDQIATAIKRKLAEEALRAGEERFRSVADLVPDLLWENDAGGMCTWYNRRWLDYTGQTMEQAVGFGWLAMVHPDDRGVTQERFRAAIASGDDFRHEHRLRGVDGQYRWFLLQARPLRDGDGKPLKWFGAASDIHEHRVALHQFAESEEKFRLLVEGAQDFAMLLHDTEGNITSWNIGAERLLGFTQAEAIGQPGAIIFTAEDRAARAPETEREVALRDGRAADNRWHIKKSGELFWGSGVMTVMRNEEGKLQGFVKVLRDETARKIAEDKLTVAKDAAEEANRVKDDFLATLSHELRTPLSAVMVWTKLLRMRDPSTEATEGLDAIEHSADALKQLIDDLLDSSRITSGKLGLEMRTTALVPAVREAIAAILPTAEAKGVRVAFELSEEVGLVRADPDRLRQVVWNLLTNALKFTPEGGRIDVGMWRRKNEVEIRVTDTGRGIEAQFLPHVFERFRQAEPSATRSSGGLGLGLAIVKQLVELHGGTIAAASEGVDRGATFSVRLPLRQVGKTVSAGTAARPRAATDEARSRRLDGRLSGMHILLVEDQPETRRALVALLTGSGAEVTAVAAADAALAAFEKRRPDVVLSDIGLPGMDGGELMRRLRVQEQALGAAPVPAVALTAFASDEDERSALAAGYNAFLTKPFEPHVLLETLVDVRSRV